MVRFWFALGFGLFVGAALVGCDALGSGDVSVRGRVVDAVTGAPVDPGPAVVSVTGASFLGPTEGVLSGEAGPDGRFDLSEEVRDGVGEFGLDIGSAGRIEYPGTDSTAALSVFDVFRFAYFPAELAYRRDVGVVELLPTCLTLGDVRFSRPLASSEQLRVRLSSVPEAPFTTLLYANGYTYEGSPAEGYTPPDTLRALGVGGRPAVLAWEINEYNPPTGNGQGVFARGSVPLPTCPRHGVLRYQATIALPE